MAGPSDAREAWVEIRVDVPPGLEDEAGAQLCEPPVTGVLVESGSVRGHARADAWTEGDRAALDGRLAALGAGPLAVRVSPVEFDDAALDWRARWRPFRVGRVVIGARESLSRLRPADVALALVPGAAFGTGRHASTRFALRLAQDRIGRGTRVLDAGAGSGILAVAALALGAESALAFDIDPNAESCATSLARDNRCASRLVFRTGGFEVLRDEDRGFDLVFANLYADLLRERAADLASRVATGGLFVAAGLRAWEANEIEVIYGALGVRVTTRRARGRWAAFSGVKEGKVVPAEGLEPSTR